MKHSLLRIFLAASLAFMPLSPGMAAVNVMSDEELGTVNARGFESQGVLGQQNNYSAVQALGAAQWGAMALSIENITDASINLTQDAKIIKDAGDIWSFSKNCQFADNGSAGEVSKTNSAEVLGQNNNQASIQFGDNAQFKASALAIINAVDAAGNVYQKLRTIENADDVTMLAFSNQMAFNSGYFTQQITNKRRATDQNNNNASIQVSGKAQENVSAVLLANMVASAQNTSQMWTGVKNSEDLFFLQSSRQYANNVDVDAEQKVKNKDDVVNQNNNNASIQITGEGQSLVKSFVVSNAAASALNIGQNMVYAEKVKELSVIQTNDQYAENDAQAFQKVWNRDDVRYQNNNNGAVQLADYAQASSQLGVLVNASGSAVNDGLNIVSASILTGHRHHRHGEPSFFTQANEQDAFNGAQRIRVESEEMVLGQKVKNRDDVRYQNNNFGAVQVTGYAQDWISAVAVTNAASSAVNVGQNFAFLLGGGHASICQFNGQTAENYAYDATQGVWNRDDVRYQNNNNGAVQVADSAQICVDVVSLANVAGSAANIGQNIASLTGGKDVHVRQTNYQSAISYAEAEQAVYNRDDVRYQNNNNGSVQLAGAQNKATSNSILNAAVSAVNIGQNIAQADVKKEASVRQFNDQVALQSSMDDDQYVKNRDDVRHQNNNNGSVQLADSQNEIKGLSILNTAASGVNVGENVAAVVAKGAKVYQKNDQEAGFGMYSSATVKNGDEVQDQYNNSSSVFGTGSGSQKQVQVLSLANIARSGVNIGQNIADVKAQKWAKVTQKNEQLAFTGFDGSQSIYNDEEIASQNNNNASVQGNDLQNSIAAGSIINAAISAVNLGQNIAKVDAGKWMKVKQVNDQDASAGSVVTQSIDNVEVVAGQNNNNASVQLIASQNGIKAISVANVAGAAANVGQNVALLKSGGEIDDSKQVNVQAADVAASVQQTVGNQAPVNNQNNNNGSVQLSGSQNNALAVSVLNAAISAVNVGQNIAKAEAAKELEFKQVNDQYARASTEGPQTVMNDGTVTGQNKNSASVQLIDSQKDAAAVSVVNAAASALNVGQNIVAASAKFADVRQVNVQTAEDPVMGNQANLAGVQLFGSQVGVKALSVLNTAVSGANVGQNVMGVDAKFADSRQINKQEASEETPVTIASSITGSMRATDSQNGMKVLSGANLTVSAVNIGQNVAKAKGWFGVELDQTNKQFASGPQVVLTTTPFTVTAVELTRSQNDVKALSLFNAAFSVGNVGQNVAKVDAGFFADVDQVNCQTAIWGGGMTPAAGATEASSNNNEQAAVTWTTRLSNSQNNTAALSIVNSAASATNVGQNVAKVDAGFFADVDQANYQTAILRAVEADVTGSITLSNSQNNTAALAIVNAVTSAVNVGQNIAKVDPWKFVHVDQVNYQKAVVGEADSVWDQSGSISLTDSQNNTAALSIVNAVASAVNVGMNIAVAEGKHADVHQVNFQCASIAPVTEDKAEASTTKSATTNSGSSSIQLVGSQTNMSALAIVNAVGSAVNVGRNIAVMNGVRGGSVTQMNFQNAYR